MAQATQAQLNRHLPGSHGGHYPEEQPVLDHSEERAGLDDHGHVGKSGCLPAQYPSAW